MIITWFIFTIDPDAEETALDLVKDFTSLVIIVEIDSMLIGFAEDKSSEIKLKK